MAETSAELFKGTKGSKPLGGPTLVSGVTAQTYGDLGRNFIKAKGQGFVIAQRKSAIRLDGGTPIEATPRQWGAWLSYLKGKGYDVAFMLSRDYFTVPAEWPHLFDIEATAIEDEAAADAYMAEVRRKIARDYDTKHAIKGAAYKRWSDARPKPRPESEIAPAPAKSFIDHALLEECYEIDASRLAAARK